jgi:hypothetical protein
LVALSRNQNSPALSLEISNVPAMFHFLAVGGTVS